ncbi:type II secretion system protein [uncultured Tateyamaria sp.]|uniref:type II secretion system protein n=1 Tax=uncultured Tateyamaria sp. TaxID=455651 RepID=UPI00262A0409|nr:type II secretion system protein [uncultured Tateyamaria sp.]
MRRRVIRSGRRDRGLTLLELAVAVLVLAMGSMAALRATDQARVAIGGAEDRTLAQLAVRNRAAELRLPPGSVPLSAEVDVAGRVITLDTASVPTAAGLTRITITGRAPSGAAAQMVIYVAGPGA